MLGVYIDLETGGLDSKVHGITEIAAVVFDLDISKTEMNLQELAKYHTLVKPVDDLAYTPAALKLQGQDLLRLECFGTPEEFAYLELRAFIEQHVGSDHPGLLWAHNAPFEHSFLLEMERRRNSGIRLFKDRCDWSCTKALCHTLQGLSVMHPGSSSLTYLLEYFQIRMQGEAHTALRDARAGIQVLQAMLAKLSQFYKGE